MKVLIVDDNLLWTHRLERRLSALGIESVVQTTTDAECDMAIVNLSNARLLPFELVRILKERGLWVLGHAGHKEKELWEQAKNAGCDRVVSNSELTNKLTDLMKAVPNAR